MSLKETVNLEEAKKVLDQLQQYIKGKSLQKQTKQNNGVIQEIPLASQPAVQSDHLVEESVLQPIEGQNLSTDKIENADQVLALENHPQDVMMTFGSSELNLGNNPSYNPAYTNTGLQTAPSDIGDNSLINNSEGQLNSDNYSDLNNKTVEGQNGEENSLVKPLPDASLNSYPQGLESASTSVLDLNNGALTAQTETVTSQLQQEPLEQPDLIQEQQSTINNTTSPTEYENGNMSGVETIPDIVMPSGGIEDKGAYQASTNGAQAVIQDVTPVASDTSVVLPNGITEEIANGDTLVVGPDSFGPSR